MKKILCLVTMLFSQTVFSADLEYTVCQVGVQGIDDVYLLPCETHTSLTCTDNWIHWKLDTPAGNGKLANAQAAVVSGKSIIVRLEGCSGLEGGGFDTAIMVRLKK